MSNKLQDFLTEANSMYGLQERKDRKALIKYLSAHKMAGLDPSTTPWCAAFVNAVVDACGLPGTGKWNARSFLKWGVSTDDVYPGTIVVLKRGNSTTLGHVGFYVTQTQEGFIHVLGGNQGDMVCEKVFPESQVLDYRIPYM